jgi:CRISPR-associated protein Csm4
MNYCLFRLRFKTEIHIGDDSGMTSLTACEEQIHSDTVFSSLCIEALQNGGYNKLNLLYSLIKDGSLLISDAFPFYNEELFLPKPFINIKSENINRSYENVKVLKKLKYIPSIKFEEYIGYMKGKNDFETETINKQFGVHNIRVMAAVSGNEETMPYNVGTFSFFKNCGLYIIAAYKSEKELEILKHLLNLLSFTGIGGKRTAGLGRFELEDEIYLDEPYTESQESLIKLLKKENSMFYMTLNVSLPKGTEIDTAIDGAFYKLVRRGGFIQSQNYSETPLKKKVMYFIAPGSCFKNKFNGDVYDVSLNGNHPVFRMAKPLFLGVNI